MITVTISGQGRYASVVCDPAQFNPEYAKLVAEEFLYAVSDDRAQEAIAGMTAEQKEGLLLSLLSNDIRRRA